MSSDISELSSGSVCSDFDPLKAERVAPLAERLEALNSKEMDSKALIRVKRCELLLDKLKQQARYDVAEQIASRLDVALRELEQMQELAQADVCLKDIHRSDSTVKKPKTLLKELKAYLEEREFTPGQHAQTGLDSLLYDRLAPVDSNDASLKSLKSASQPSDQLNELKSLQNYREYLGRVVTENMVRQVIKEDPENAGPLNPQRLLVRTLSAMRDISPAYVNRLVPYYDTLMLLESIDKDVN